MRIRVGVAGLGFMGTTHLAILEEIEDVEVVAVCSPSGRGFDVGYLETQGNVGPARKVDISTLKKYRDPLEMICDPDIDVVDLCMPTSTRVELVEASVKANKHIICEKPLAASFQGANQVYEAVKSSGSQKLFLPAMCVQFWPQYSEALEIARSQKYGKLISGRMLRQGAMPKWGTHFAKGQESGGGLYDLLVHDVHYLQQLMGADPFRISANNRIGQSGRVDSTQAFLKYEDGASIVLEGGWRVQPSYEFKMDFEFYFERASVHMGEKGLRIFTSEKEEILEVSSATGWEIMLRHFVDCLIRGIPQQVTLEQAAEAVKLCERIERTRP
jgi:predicted dehydrogenase